MRDVNWNDIVWRGIAVAIGVAAVLVAIGVAIGWWIWGA
jgi:hypothetical protein